jgi:hypothetical protein
VRRIVIVLLIEFSAFAGQLPRGIGIEAVRLSVILLLAVSAIGPEVRTLHWQPFSQSTMS